jgi:ferredoxin like protein
MVKNPQRTLKPELAATLPRTNVDDLLLSVKYYVDEDYGHIRIKDHAVCTGCEHRPCLDFCPAGVFTQDRAGKIMVGFQACLECGSCRIGCPYHNIDWNLPRGGYGVAYKFG